MSPAEAIATLQALRYVSAMTAAHIKGKTGQTANKEVEAIQEGIDALRKQIPQKPIMQHRMKICPSCLDSIGNGEGYTFDFCENCGQALDWSILDQPGGGITGQ